MEYWYNGKLVIHNPLETYHEAEISHRRIPISEDCSDGKPYIITRLISGTITAWILDQFRSRETILCLLGFGPSFWLHLFESLLWLSLLKRLGVRSTLNWSCQVLVGTAHALSPFYDMTLQVPHASPSNHAMSVCSLVTLCSIVPSERVKKKKKRKHNSHLQRSTRRRIGLR